MSCSGWREVRLEEIGTRFAMGPFGSDIKSSNFVEKGVPVIRGVNLTIGKFNDKDFVYLTEEKANELIGSNAFPNDIVFTHRGTLGQVGIIPKMSYKRYVISQSQMKMTCDTRIAYPLFVYYFFRSPIGLHKLLCNTSTTGVPAIARPLTSLKSVELNIPPLVEQKAIADTLSCLDDKIELNNRINKNLEEMAQAIFKSWFVDFEPFQDGEFEDSQLGMIPKGWRVGTLDDLISDTISGDWGKEAPQGNYSEKVVCIRGADIPEIASGKKGKPPIRYILKNNAEKKRLSKGQIIIEISGGSPTQSTGRTALITHELVNIAGRPLICTNFCRALSMKKELYVTFVYSMLQYLYNKDLFFLYENGTTGIKNLDTNNLFSRHLIVLPNDNTMARYKEIFDTIINSVYQNGAEINKLETTRDTLLPKLMSGEIRVPIKEADNS